MPENAHRPCDTSPVNDSLKQTLIQCLSRNGVDNTEKASLSTSLLIMASLRQAQCCYRCVLRYLGCSNQELYAHNIEELDLVMDHLWRPTRTLIGICTACLGTLQLADDDALTLQPILNQLKNDPYETNDFALTLTLPVSLIHRDQLLKLHIQEQLQHIQPTHSWTPTLVRDTKEPIRTIVIQRLACASGLVGDLNSPFHICLCLGHSSTETDHLFLTKVKDPVLKIRQVQKRGVITTIGDSRHNITEALKSLDLEEARTLTTIPPLPPSEKAQVISVNLWHDSTLTGGRYNKFSRVCSQTPWIIQGKRLSPYSVSECITPIFKRHHQCQDVKFVTAGREDADVRMLGTGRPFYCELVNPRRPLLSTEEYHQMEHEINASSETANIVQVRQIQNISLSDTKLIKEGEETKRKSYQAIVWFSMPLTQDILDRCNKGNDEFIIYQKTPIRVFQRRAAATREKMIYHMSVKRLDDDLTCHYALVTLITQAGTYIKEFVHGDLGRTQPNLASIAGVDAADLLDLDVLEVDLIWPPLV
ncbi:hypothetical protein BC941DRAFT_373629 [Chlamydoabsidia padenii]|nr:hypothetical protein BC941DRAFT_373629 [Chlamydoabsidia padenii]